MVLSLFLGIAYEIDNIAINNCGLLQLVALYLICLFHRELQRWDKLLTN